MHLFQFAVELICLTSDIGCPTNPSLYAMSLGHLNTQFVGTPQGNSNLSLAMLTESLMKTRPEMHASLHQVDPGFFRCDKKKSKIQPRMMGLSCPGCARAIRWQIGWRCKEHLVAQVRGIEKFGQYACSQ